MIKKISADEWLSAIYFTFIYALSRLILTLPSLDQQDPEVLAIFFGVMILAWIVYNWQKSIENLMTLSLGIVITAVFFLLNWLELFNIMAVELAVLSIGGLSLIIFTIMLIFRITRKNYSWFGPVFLRVLMVIAVLSILEYLVLPLIVF